jgi:hypothetical protein
MSALAFVREAHALEALELAEKVSVRVLTVKNTGLGLELDNI